VPPVVPGFVAFSSIPEMLAASADVWRVPAERMPAKADLTAHARAIEAYLAVTNNQAAGILRQHGSLWWAPAATWRKSCFVDGGEVHAAVAAMHAKSIQFPGKGLALECYPILSCRALALSFGAEKPPVAPPQFVLSDIQEIDRPQKLPAGPSAARVAAPREAESAERPAPIYRTGTQGRTPAIEGKAGSLKPRPVPDSEVRTATPEPAEVPAPQATELRKAPKTEIRRAIQAEYDAAKSARTKAPNVVEIKPLVSGRLEAAGFTASHREIQKIAGEDCFKKQRVGVGKRMRSVSP
jgi:hypothetical protein